MVRDFKIYKYGYYFYLNTHMNYKKIYKKLIEKAKSACRSKKGNEYYEKHHIVPDFMFINRKRKGPKGHLEGNPNDPKNLVLLTPREHIVAHMLLYKILKGTHYEYSAGSALIFFKVKLGNKAESTYHPRMREFLGYDKTYDNCRQIARRCISLKNEGWVNVKHAETNEYFGRMSTSDPRYQKGEYVHHTKGRKASDDERNQHRARVGKLNGNYKELTPEVKQRVFEVLSKSIVEDTLYIKLFMEQLKQELVEFKKLSTAWIKNRFGSFEELIKIYNIETSSDIRYNRWFRSKEVKEKISRGVRQYMRITNGDETILISKDDNIPIGYRIGRSNAKGQKD